MIVAVRVGSSGSDEYLIEISPDGVIEVTLIVQDDDQEEFTVTASVSEMYGKARAEALRYKALKNLEELY